MGDRKSVILPLALTLFLAVFMVSCEESGLDDFPYVERMVVGSVLDAGSDNVLLFFARTLPLSEPYDPQNAVLTGVTGHVMHGGTAYPLVQLVPGLYQAQGLSIVSGETYELTAEWQGKRVSATTRVPFPPSVVSSTATIDSAATDRLTLQSLVRVGASEVYGQTWSTTGSGGAENGGEFTEIGRASDADLNGEVLISESYSLTVAPGDTLFAVIHAFDQPFYDFFISRGGNVPGYDDLLFREIGGFVSWNVEGDGIGIFLGRATTRTRAEFR